MTDKEILKILLKKYKLAVHIYLYFIKKNIGVECAFGKVSALEEMILALLPYKNRMFPGYAIRASRKIKKINYDR